MDPLSLGLLIGFILGTLYIELMWYRRNKKNGKDKLAADIRDQILKELAGRITKIEPRKKE